MNGNSSLTTADLASKVTEILQSVIADRELENLHARPNVPLAPYFSMFGRVRTESSVGGRADLVTTRELDWTPASIDTIDELDRWFPQDTLEVPMAIIEFTSTPPMGSADAVHISAMQKLAEPTPIMPMVVRYGGPSTEIESSRGDIHTINLYGTLENTVVWLC